MNDGHHTKLYGALAGYFGYTEFRPLQREIIEDALRGKDTFVLMPTGGGKSLCYQLPALLMDGLTVVVSPLIALMKDQVDALVASGVAATYINSSLAPEEVKRRLTSVRSGAVKLLYVAPERLTLPFFIEFLSHIDLSLFAIDEAHCISHWGHDFREDYRKLRIIREKFPAVPIMALTATATPRVAADILEQLHLQHDTGKYKASFNRPNLTYYVKRKTDAFDDLLYFLRPRKGESGIVYCLSRKSTESVAERLRDKGFRALAYHAGMDNVQRAKHQEQFIRDEVDIICATIAFGMGIDKSNVRFVVHYDLPKNLEGYYQETGRAGRDGLPSDCLLLYAPGDRIRLLRFIEDSDADPAITEHNKQSLNLMCRYAEARSCRKRMVLEYFDEKLEAGNCGKCDICLGTHKIDWADFTVAAQKFLSTMMRTSQKFGAKYIVNILRGTDDDDRIMHNHHHELTTFGIGKDLKEKEWMHVSQELEREGYILRDEYKSLKLTPKGSEALVNRYNIMLASLPQRGRSAEARAERLHAIPDFPALNTQLFEVLRTLRKQIADEKNVPPDVIFHDTVLRQMAASLPFTKHGILRLSGVGEKKADDFGEIFGKTINAFVQKHPEIQPLTITSLPQPRQPYVKSSETVLATVKLFQKGVSPYEIAKERGLSPSVISNHIEEGIKNGDITDIGRLVPAQYIERIRNAFRVTGSQFLKSAMLHLNDMQITYDHLKFVRAYDERQNNR